MKIEDEVNRLVAGAVQALTPLNVLTLDEFGNIVLASDKTKKVEAAPNQAQTDSIFSLTGKVDDVALSLDKLQKTASESAVLTAELSDRMSFLEQFFNTISNSSIATDSASTASNAASVITFDKKLIAEEDLTVLGKTNLSDLAVTGDIMSGMIVIGSVDSSISTITGTLRLQTGMYAGDIEAFGGKITMTSKGDIEVVGKIKADTVAAKKFTVLGIATEVKESSNSATLSAQLVPQQEASIGQFVLPAGETEVVIENINIDANSKIFITATTSTEGQSLIVSEKSTGRAKITIDTAVSSDINFDYWIVGVE